MKDQYQRTIDYMRVSITDRCNLRCRYCMPDGIEFIPHADILTFEEIIKIIACGAQLGISKIKITGGEPLVRAGCCDLMASIKKIPGISQVTLTTNGILLPDHIDELKAAGTDGINISLDTLDPDLFARITGSYQLDRVLAGVDAAVSASIPTKINTVLQRGVNDGEWQSILEMAKDRPIDVRFIELMPIGAGDKDQGISSHEIRDRIRSLYPDVEEDTRIHGNGPAVYMKIPGFAGSVGFIGAVSEKFCETCNRIRLTSVGRVKPCLCYGDSFDLRSILRSDSLDQENELKETLRMAIAYKPKEHCFEKNSRITEKKKMNQIGG